MRRSRFALVVIAMIAIVSLALVGGCAKRPPENLGSVSVVPDGPIVSVKGGQFNPADVEITQGQTVTWRNDDNLAHVIKSNDFKGGPLDPDTSFAVKFDKAGTYTYFCGVHKKEEGKIVVK